MVKVLAIRRDERFSPNSVDVDREILHAVVARLVHYEVRVIDEVQLTMADEADVYISMGRLPQTLRTLKAKEEEYNRLVVNSAKALESFSRSGVERLMRVNGIPVAPGKGYKGYWVKRGDAAAQSKNDVVYCANEQDMEACVAKFRERGVKDVVVSAHIEGDLIKFYGVGNRFFRHYYPTDGGRSKFGDEARNGVSQHYPFDVEALQNDVFRLAELVHMDVYGGDCIVDGKGNYFIIDFNDWPSFSRCRDEAADAIARLIESFCAAG